MHYIQGKDGLRKLDLQKGDSDLSYAAAEALEAILEGSAGAAQLEDLRAIERLGDVFPIEARDQADRRGQQRLEINCRPLKRPAYAELLRRGAAAVAKTV